MLLSFASVFSDPNLIISILGVLIPVYLHFHPRPGNNNKGKKDKQNVTDEDKEEKKR